MKVLNCSFVRWKDVATDWNILNILFVTPQNIFTEDWDNLIIPNNKVTIVTESRYVNTFLGANILNWLHRMPPINREFWNEIIKSCFIFTSHERKSRHSEA